MDWFEALGAYYMAMPDTPALAVDMAVNGPDSGLGMGLTYSMLSTESEIEPYPPDELDFGGLG